MTLTVGFNIVWLGEDDVYSVDVVRVNKLPPSYDTLRDAQVFESLGEVRAEHFRALEGRPAALEFDVSPATLKDAGKLMLVVRVEKIAGSGDGQIEVSWSQLFVGRCSP